MNTRRLHSVRISVPVGGVGRRGVLTGRSVTRAA